jgi:predicted  nucleic acid-binding Zn-ribbon protein
LASDESPGGPREPQLSLQELVELDKVLSDFRKALVLPTRDPGRAVSARRMRATGFSVSQINALSGGRWPESTIKRYVAGVKAEGDGPARKVLEFLIKALDENVTVAAIHDFVETKGMLSSLNVELKDIADFISLLRKQNIPLDEFVRNYKTMKELGFTPTYLKTVLGYKEKLEEVGFGMNNLQQISISAQAFGGPEQVLAAINEYGEIGKLQAESQRLENQKNTASNELSEVKKKITESERQLASTTKQITSAQSTLMRLEELTRLGYDDEALRDLSTNSSNLGGVGPALSALTKFKTLNELEVEIGNLQQKAAELRLEKTKMETSNAHLAGHIDATRKLIEEQKLTLDAIHSILRIAEKYGSPQNVLRAFEEYDSIQQLQTEQRNLAAEIGSKRTELTQLEDLEKTQRGKVDQQLQEIEAKAIQLKEMLVKSFGDMKIMLSAETKTLLDSALQDFEKSFEETKEKVKSEVQTVVNTAHQTGIEVEKLRSQLEEKGPFFELMELNRDPRDPEVSPRILSTFEALLPKLEEWVEVNQKKIAEKYLLESAIHTLRDKLREAAEGIK